MSYENEIASEIRDFILDLRSAYEGDWLPRIELILAQAAALQARVAELETENIDLISEIVQIDCRDYGRGEYQTQSLANQELIDRLVAAGRMRHKRDDHKGRPIYEFVVSAGRTQEAEVAALKVRIAELEAGAQWRPASEPPAEPPVE